jgi:hypothetical protein
MLHEWPPEMPELCHKQATTGHLIRHDTSLPSGYEIV